MIGTSAGFYDIALPRVVPPVIVQGKVLRRSTSNAGETTISPSLVNTAQSLASVPFTINKDVLK